MPAPPPTCINTVWMLDGLCTHQRGALCSCSSAAGGMLGPRPGVAKLATRAGMEPGPQPGVRKTSWGAGSAGLEGGAYSAAVRRVEGGENRGIDMNSIFSFRYFPDFSADEYFRDS